jgi:hypothetical protein
VFASAGLHTVHIGCTERFDAGQLLHVRQAAPAHSAVARRARRALPVELGMDRYNHRNATKNERSTGSARERHGLFRYGAFGAARVRRPPIQNIRERYFNDVLRARISGRLISSRLVSSSRTAAFC